MTAGNTITLQGTGGLTLLAGGAVAVGPAVLATGNVSITAGGAVTQTGALTASGTVTVAAGTNAVSLTNTANAITGTVSITGGATSIADASSLTLGASSVSSLTVTANDIASVTGVSVNNGGNNGSLSVQQLGATQDVRLGGAVALGSPTVLDVNDAVLAGFSNYNALTVGTPGSSGVSRRATM